MDAYTTELELTPEFSKKLALALDPTQLEKLGCHNCPLPIICDLGDELLGQAGENEIKLSKVLETRTADFIRSVYLHEYTHTIAPRGHNTIFFAVALTLYRRANVAKFQACRLYDFTDDIDQKDFGSRLAFAVQFSKRYTNSSLDGPALAKRAIEEFPKAMSVDSATCYYETEIAKQKMASRLAEYMTAEFDKRHASEARAEHWERTQRETAKALRRWQFATYALVGVIVGGLAWLILQT